MAEPEGDLPRLIHDPPYTHQADAIRGCLVDGSNLVIMTGTGSGKTEAFLLPILGKFADEARRRPDAFSAQSAMRALILYPINALVNDQLGRLRSMFGDPRIVGSSKDGAPGLRVSPDIQAEHRIPASVRSRRIGQGSRRSAVSTRTFSGEQRRTTTPDNCLGPQGAWEMACQAGFSWMVRRNR